MPPTANDSHEQVVIGGKNKYVINGHTVQASQVQNLFHSVQLNVNNPHFLIMQGRITKVYCFIVRKHPVARRPSTAMVPFRQLLVNCAPCTLIPQVGKLNTYGMVTAGVEHEAARDPGDD